MLLFVLSSFAWLTRPPSPIPSNRETTALHRVQIHLRRRADGRRLPAWCWRCKAITRCENSVPKGCWALRWRLSMIRELGPVLAALMVTARAGSAMTAEIGIMRITEQIDALDTMAINPLQYLIAPKLVAGLIGVPLLVAIFDVVGIYGGYLVGVDLLGVNEGAYWNSIESAVEWKDVYGGILKSISFGLIISWICCYKGFYTRQSAEGLGTATTEAVVLSSVLILVWDYFLTSVLL